MMTYRFRVKVDADPTALWRDVVTGGDRSLTGSQATINEAVGLDQDQRCFPQRGR